MPDLILAEDARCLKQILEAFILQMPATSWGKYTEKNNTGWTFHQTVAHVVAVMEGFTSLIESALSDGTSKGIPGLEVPGDFARWNTNQIQRLQTIPIKGLENALIDGIERIIYFAETLSDDKLVVSLNLPIYNQNFTIYQALVWQLMHTGLVHGGQITRVQNAETLWMQFPVAMLRRLIVTFMDYQGYIYHPPKDTDSPVTIHYIICGEEGGRWQLELTAADASLSEELLSKADIVFRFRNIYAFCRLMTFEIPPFSAIFRGEMLMTGNIRLALRLPDLLQVL
ncbi:MAG: hypothetical protein ACPG7F_20035 [Aggregatilineales bacterium]